MMEMLDSKPELQNSLENLKTDVETRASNLEDEVEAAAGRPQIHSRAFRLQIWINSN